MTNDDNIPQSNVTHNEDENASQFNVTHVEDENIAESLTKSKSYQTFDIASVNVTNNEDEHTPQINVTHDDDENTAQINVNYVEDENPPQINVTHDEDENTPKIKVTLDDGTPVLSIQNEAPKMKLVIPDPAVVNSPEIVGKEEVPAPKRWEHMTVELFMFLYMFGSTLEMTANGNLFMDRVCLVNMNQSEEICSNLTGNQGLLNRVQAQSNNMSVYVLLIAMVPGAAYAMFAGTWSDKYGRKPLLYFSLIGTIFHDVMYLLFVYFDTLPVEYCLITYLPVSLSGGLISIMGMVYSLTSDKTSVENRTIKFAILEACIFLAIPIAGVTAGQIYKYYDYLPVYGFTLTVHLVALLFLTFVLTETNRGPSGVSLCAKIADFVKLDAVKENFETCFKRRENYGRAKILFLMFAGCLLLLNYTSLNTLNYYYTNKVYGWELPEFTTVSTIFSIATMVVMVVALPVSQRLMKVSDASLGLVGSLSLAAQNITRAFSYQPWIFYLSYASGLLSGMAALAFRSMLSKVVQKDELGKIFAVLAIFESLAPTPGGLLFTQIYNHSLDTFPGLVFLVGGLTLLFPIATFVWLVKLPSTPDFEKLEGDVPSSQPNLEPEERRKDATT